EADVNRINVLYDFLIEKTKKEYHRYISAVICLKAFCLKDGILKQNKAIRIIMEFIFLAKVLKIESEKTDNVKEIQKYRNTYIDAMKEAIGLQNMEYAINTDTSFLDESKVPRSSILLEIFVLVELFSNDSFKMFLDERINEKIFKEKKERFANDCKIKESYLKKIFENEISTLSSEGKKRFFCPPEPESPNPDPESKKSDGFGIKEIIFYILLPILAVSGIFIVGYLFLYKKR
ncbi:hypothetical protein CWI36_3515p0010, partial [Hamiltosporidium magnivora]